VTSVVGDAACLTVGSVVSPLLFYAGTLPDAPPALRGSYCRGGGMVPSDPPSSSAVDVQVASDLPASIGPVFLVYRNLEGGCWEWGGCQVSRAQVGTMWLDGLSGGAGTAVRIMTTTVEAGEEGTVMPPDWLMAEETSLAAMLTDAGLREAEAQALLYGWRHVFLDLQPDDNMVSVPLGESVAAVYLLPRAYFDDVLPIRIEPAPRRLVRVGLGLEWLPLSSACADVPEAS
jgi:hypothetical protein